MAIGSRGWAQVVTGVVALGILGGALVSTERRPEGKLHPETVVADFGVGAAQPAAIAAALKVQRADPDDLTKTVEAAKLMIDEGRAKGDSRLVGAALSILQPFVVQGALDALLLAATARQYQHDFAGALALLDKVLLARPQDTTALLNRATLHTVRGNYDLAQKDCATIATLRSDVGFLCHATSLTMTMAAPDIAERLAEILAAPGLLDEQLVPWATSLLAEIAMLQNDRDTAITLLQAVLQDDPAAQREQLMLADLRRAEGQHEQVLALLESAPDTDGVLIRRVLALRATGKDAATVEAELAQRVQRNLDIGLTAHAREETMYFLLIEPNPVAALERAEVNWALQHEFDDLQLLLDAAAAAGQPEAARPALDWMRDAGIAIPALRMPAPALP